MKHEKNPRDREFLNDIFRSVRSIRNAALRAGFGRISELTFHMAGLLDRVTQKKMEPDADLLDVVVSVRDRILELVGEIENSGSERAPVKDLIDRIRLIEERMGAAQEAGEERKPLAVDTVSPDPEAEVDLTPLLDEIRNEEYDPELFQIYLDQTQENLSLLRSLTESFVTASNKTRVIGICSALLGKLQSSANYMGYERLADFFLQWIAELEMVDVELSVGGPVSFTFMDRNIRLCAALFPQIRDVPAHPTLLKKTTAAWAESLTESEPPENEETGGSDLMKNLFSSIDEETEPFDEDTEPISALTDYEPALKIDSGPNQPRETRLSRKKTANGAPLALDPSFLKEERFSEEFDEELYRIFVQQVQENLSQLLTLTDSYPKSPNKSRVVEQCSNLLGKLQSSANYMGYEPLAEYYLQWIAELEMTGVDISLGKKVPFAFMDERIRQVAALFPDIRVVPAESFAKAPEAVEPDAAPADAIAGPSLEQEDEFSASLQDLFGATDEGEEDILDDNAAPVTALAGQEGPDDESPITGMEEAGGQDRRTTPEPAVSAKSAADDLDALFGDGEEDREPPAPDKAEPLPSPVGDPSRSALLQKISAALKSLDGEAPAIETETALPERTAQDEDLNPDLYERLLGALDAVGQDADAGSPDHVVAQVMDEILAVPAAAHDDAAMPTPTPVQGTGTPDGETSPAPETDGSDSFMQRVNELIASRSSLARLYPEMTSFRNDLAHRERMDMIKLSPLKNLIFPLNDAETSSGRIPSEITAALLKIRMIPVSSLFGLFRAVVADHARGGNKKIWLDILGDEAEIDQGMACDLAQCLRPIVDNAAIHGIETTVERRFAGKTEAGSICLAAYHDHNHLVIEVVDDGRGIDPGKIKAAALAAELYTGDELYRMSDDELISVLLSPDFTATFAAVSDHGGGMHLVRQRIDRLNGSIRVKSSTGRGTLVELRIPLRNPIFKALKFAAGAGRFALPLCGVDEVLRLESRRIMEKDGGEIIHLRDETIPAFTLSRFLNVEQTDQRGKQVYIVVVTSGAGKAGLIVDSIIGLEEVVIRPLAEHIGKKSGLGAGPVRDEDEISFLPDMDGIMESLPGKQPAPEKDIP